MSLPDQCPSTIGEKEFRKPRSVPLNDQGVSPSGQPYWRGLDELADTQDFRDWLEREFPSGASELLESSRRTFVKLMGASLALAGAATLPGCRRPDHKIMPYSQVVPEDAIPGKAKYFATAMPLPGGGAEGLLVETHEGRPTKIEGNPNHPINRGKSSVWSQGSILGLYDPDRLKDPVFTDSDPAHPMTARSWEDFRLWSQEHFKKFDSTGGKGLAFIADAKTSPTLRAMRQRTSAQWPSAMWVSHDPTAVAATAGAREMLHLDKAKVVVSLDRDFMVGEPASLKYAREFMGARRVLAATDEMNRLYVVESRFSITGSKADHRLRAAPSVVPAFAVALAKALALGDSVPGVAGMDTPAALVDQHWIDAVAEDLAANRGKGLVVAGATQPAWVHAVVRAINAALGNVGQTVEHLPAFAGEGQSIEVLAAAMSSGAIATVVVLDCNPVYDAPAGLGFAAAFAKVPMRITLSVGSTETAAASQWQLPGAHYLESWGDVEAWDGTVSAIQPMIAPLYGSKSDIEVLAMLVGEEQADGYHLVRTVWQQALGGEGSAFEKAWRRALHDGIATTWARPQGAANVPSGAQGEGSVKLAAAPTQNSLDVVFMRGMVADGRYANVAWLQELPEVSSRMVWDNAAMVSPATAEALGMVQDKETAKKRYATMADLKIGDSTMQVPVWAVPGIPEHTVVLAVGYGREVCGHVGTGVGFNAYAVKPAGAMMASGATLTRASRGPSSYMIATTQAHGSMEGRAIIREFDLPAWKNFGEQRVPKTDPYGRSSELTFAERLGELSHTPVNESIYTNPLNKSGADAAPGSAYASRPQWGMSIDMTSCIGCNVCTVACQSENNIPVVGKTEVNKGRELHWIRVDRYFVGDDRDNPEYMSYQPVPCVQCENAPCETVCPVNATVHGPEGINYQVYNRCIGTRYCANNCPYKVRRFNFFDYGVKKYNGDYVGKSDMPLGGPENENLIPPRFREQLDEIAKMGMNPDVTVRSRGVMEKCTYCIQRLNEARIEMKLTDAGLIADGAVLTACQQACPTDAIVFGDLLDTTSNSGKGSLAGQMRGNGRSYMLLGYLNTRPRTTYMAGIRNPNPKLVSSKREESWSHPFDHGGHDDHAAPAGGHEESHDGHGHSMLDGVIGGVDGGSGRTVHLTILGAMA
ncbi:MAG: TAT-variant-translocated molybdopterin oxidoreductase [Phycisphaerales bacterium]|nr:TAT-variant-translocated molybdopterin oxidoreductase [Phycisphaerales bacterium]